MTPAHKKVVVGAQFSKEHATECTLKASLKHCCTDSADWENGATIAMSGGVKLAEVLPNSKRREFMMPSKYDRFASSTLTQQRLPH
jgi:hypothetical protein